MGFGDRTLFLPSALLQPRLRRFNKPDPIGLSGGDTNLFAYTFNTPTRWTDPSGLEVFPKGVPIMKLPPSKLQAVVTVAPFIYTAAILAPAAPAVIAAASKLIRDNVKLDGPNAGFYQPNRGRLCQLRVRKQVIFRVDHQQRNPGGPRELHLHILPTKANPHGLELPPRK